MVAPHVGAWIETKELLLVQQEVQRSRPTWARGLKLQYKDNVSYVARRAPRGRVD